jgi:hypothetical protein
MAQYLIGVAGKPGHAMLTQQPRPITGRMEF